MRVIHTSDWHIGRRLHEVDLHEAHAAFLEWLLQLAVEREVDAVLVAGDVYDRAIPPVQSVQLLSDTLDAFAAADVPLILSSGNHDSATRLGFGPGALAKSGLHLRTDPVDLAEPILLTDEHGQVGVYAIPYLQPQLQAAALESEATHLGVLQAAVERIKADAAERGLDRTIVLSHSFITSATGSDSERDIAVGGIGDVPASVFDGFTYVALGHLHGPQAVNLGVGSTTLRYSGSPLPFSFSERDHTKSVAMVEIDADGAVEVSTIPTPQPRPMRQVEGLFDDLLALTDAELENAWVKAIITDDRAPENPMPRLRERWPHTITIELRPSTRPFDESEEIAQLREQPPPIEVCRTFVRAVSGVEANEAETSHLRATIEEAGINPEVAR